MANKQYTVGLNDLTPKSLICVRGRLTYSRLAKHIDGEELERDNARRKASNGNPINRPYTTATICDARVLFVNPQAEQNPTLRTREETYALEHMYQSMNNKNSGWNYNAVNKSRNLPRVFEYNRESGKYDPVSLTGELDNGLDVTLVMRVFKGQNGNNGISLDQVCINEPVRYYSGGIDLSAYGIITSESVAPAPTEAAAPVQPTQPVAPIAPVAPAAQPVTGGFATQPAAPAAMPYQAPAPAGMPAAPAGPSAFGAYPAAPAPAAPVAPAPGGIQYNPANDPSRQY